jgi:glutathione S-transferase
MSELTLYGESTWVSPWVFHAMTALEEKRLPYRLELLPLPILAEQKAELGQHAAMVKVPMLVHGALHLTESLAISEYHAETFPHPDHPPLLPEDLVERAVARQVMSWLRTDLSALREARPTTSVFGAPVTAPLGDRARKHAGELLAVAARVVPAGRRSIGAAWSIADADLSLALMRLIKNGDDVPAPLRAYAEATWARPSVRVYLDRAAAAA